jgi:hypothetical protein
VVGLEQLFTSTVRAEIRRKQLEPVSAMLREVQAEEQGKISRYQWVDQKAGVLRIPIDRARQLVLSDYADTRSKSGPPPKASGNVRSAPPSAQTERATEVTTEGSR